MADRIVVMRGDIIQQIGRRLIFTTTVFVADFIGSPAMNFIPGTVQDGVFVAHSTAQLPLSANAHGDAATYGIRPEHLKNDGGFPAEVVVIAPMGSSTQIIAKVAETLMMAISSERLAPQPGSTVRLMPQVAAVHLFDRDGARINY